MVRRLVNEKTLELNITHELMNLLGIQLYGFTQQEESNFGGDVTFYPPLGNPIIIQYKKPIKGYDGQYGKFNINNNKWKNQHRVLDMISRTGMIDTYYFFPLVQSNNFLINNFGNLINHTMMFESNLLTGNLNWINQVHEVEIWNDGNFMVHSNHEYEAKGMVKDEFLNYIKNKIYVSKIVDMSMEEYITTTIAKIEAVVKKGKIMGQSEHTFLFFGQNETTEKIGYFQLPIRIRGLSKDDLMKQNLE